MTAKQSELSWLNDMAEDANGDFLKFIEDDEKVLEILSDPVRSESNFADKDGNPKPQWTFEVIEEGSKKVQKWSVSSKPLLSQMVAIMKKEGLKSIGGSAIRVTAAGSGKDRKWFVKLLRKGAA